VIFDLASIIKWMVYDPELISPFVLEFGYFNTFRYFIWFLSFMQMWVAYYVFNGDELLNQFTFPRWE